MIKTYGSFEIEFSGEEVIAVTYLGRSEFRIQLEDIVFSNGRHPKVPKGICGIVTRLRIPGTEEFTTNIFGVLFMNRTELIHMKFEELDIEEIMALNRRPRRPLVISDDQVH